jgi:hypothetical protein
MYVDLDAGLATTDDLWPAVESDAEKPSPGATATGAPGRSTGPNALQRAVQRSAPPALVRHLVAAASSPAVPSAGAQPGRSAAAAGALRNHSRRWGGAVEGRANADDDGAKAGAHLCDLHLVRFECYIASRHRLCGPRCASHA